MEQRNYLHLCWCSGREQLGHMQEGVFPECFHTGCEDCGAGRESIGEWLVPGLLEGRHKMSLECLGANE